MQTVPVLLCRITDRQFFRLQSEGLRTGSLYLVGNIRVSQILSLILIFIGVILIVFIKNNKIRNKEYHGNYLR